MGLWGSMWDFVYPWDVPNDIRYLQIPMGFGPFPFENESSQRHLRVFTGLWQTKIDRWSGDQRGSATLVTNLCHEGGDGGRGEPIPEHYGGCWKRLLQLLHQHIVFVDSGSTKINLYRSEIQNLHLPVYKQGDAKGQQWNVAGLTLP